MPEPSAYVVFDCETTGTDPEVDEIVSFALVRLDGNGAETLRWTRLVRPSQPIPADATAVHGITDADVAGVPPFVEVAGPLFCLLEDAVFVAHNAPFDLAMLRHGLARVGVSTDRRSPAPWTPSACSSRSPTPTGWTRSASGTASCSPRPMTRSADVLATAALLRVLIHEYDVAPETVELDHAAFMRLRSRGDTRPASEPQIRRVFGLARPAGFLLADGSTDRERVVALVERVAGTADVDTLTRAQVQDVYDELELLIATRAEAA